MDRIAEEIADLRETIARIVRLEEQIRDSSQRSFALGGSQ